MKFLTGDDTGILKLVKVEAQKVERLGPQRTNDAIERLCWSGPAEDRESRVAVAYASGLLETRDTPTGKVLSSARAAESVRCLQVLGSGLLAVSADGRGGIVREWCGDTCPEGGEKGAESPAYAGSQPISRAVASTASASEAVAESSTEGPWLKQFQLQGPVAAACLDPCRTHQLAFGGGENDVKLFDLERSEVTWRAKNVRENFLCLRVPVAVNTLSWATEMAPSRSLLLCGSSDGKVRLYDTSTQRRPLFELKIGYGTGQGSAGHTGAADDLVRPVNCAAVAKVFTRNSGSAWSLFVADTVGTLREYDLRHLPTCKAAEIPPGGKKHLALAAKQMPFRRGYRGVMGSIRAVDVHTSGEAVVAVGLGRFAYVFETKKRSRASLLGKVYLKQKLNTVLFSTEERAGSKDDGDQSGNESDATGDLDGALPDADADEVQEGFSSDEEGNDGDDENPLAAGDGESNKSPKAKAKKVLRRKKKRKASSAVDETGEASADDKEASTTAKPVRRQKKRKASAA